MMSPLAPAKESYEKFMGRCEIFFPHSKCVEISVVYALAKHYHRFDTRKDERDAHGNPLRYFEHPRRVALLFLDEIALPDPDLVILALLHDAVEDTRLAPEAITLVCGPEIAKRVMILSKKPKDGFHQRLLDHGDYKTLLVKVADRLDNIRSLSDAPPAFMEKQLRETRELYYPLAATMVIRTPPEMQPKALSLQSKLLSVTEAMGKVLEAKRAVEAT